MMRRELIQVQPTNLGAGVFGARSGLPQIIFEIPKVPKIMNGKSMRISGTFETFVSDGISPQNKDNWCAAAPTNDVYIDGRTGVASAFDIVSIQNLEGATYENIKSYNRLCSSIMPLSESIKTYTNGGLDSQYGGLSKEVSTAAKCDKPFEFSIPILAGFLQGTPIDLELVKGLRIIITLAPDNFVLRNNHWRHDNSTGGVNNGGAFYRISDLNLSFEAEIPPAAGQEAMMRNQNGAWEYEAYSSFYNVVQSNDHNAVLNINTGRTISTIMNMIPSKFLNNYNYNSQWTTQLLTDGVTAGIPRNRVVMKDLTFTKGGLRIPLDMEIRSEESQKQGVSTSMKNFEELNAIRNVWSVSNFVKSLRTSLSLPTGNEVAANGATGQARFNAGQYEIADEDKLQQYNIGVGYDHITENGLNFKGTPLGIRIQSVAPTGTTLTPHSLFCFVKHKNTVVFRNGAVSIQN